MALAQFVHMSKNINVSARIGAPKKATMQGWYKAARNRLSDIPNIKESNWAIIEEHADLRWVKFEFRNTDGDKCQLVIDRTVPSLGV